ncbi:MAG: cupredoxin domain-containing protein [Patescibacteria group bacterium]
MKAFWIIVVLVVLIGAGWYYVSTQNARNELTPLTGSVTPPPPEALEDSNKVKVQMTASGFNPSEVRIKPGQTVEFINTDSADHWPASGVHPTHQLCQGFDARGPVTPGSTSSFPFTSPRECPMHDHLNPTLKGKVIVEP